MKTARQNTGQEKLFVFLIVYLTGSTPQDAASWNVPTADEDVIVKEHTRKPRFSET